MDLILKVVFYFFVLAGAVSLIRDHFRIESLSNKIEEKGNFYNDYPEYERYFNRNIEIINSRIEALEKEKIYAVIVDGKLISGITYTLDGEVEYDNFETFQNVYGQKLNLEEASHIAEKLKGKVVKYRDNSKVILDFTEGLEKYA